MGYMMHHAIILDSWDDKVIQKAVDKAKELGMTVLGPSPRVTNNHSSAMICPDGSKEGWPESDAADKARDAFVEWAKTLEYGDGSGPLSWVELSFGGDEPDLNTQVLRYYGQGGFKED
jgi:hypothetical protein